MTTAFRGITFTRQGRTFRQVNRSYADPYNHLMDSGLYRKLAGAGAIIRHKESGLKHALDENAYRVIQLQTMPFVTYPYEWAFSQWRDAALHVLDIQETALEFGMTLDETCVFDMQFMGGKPIFTDTFAFEMFKAGQAWKAYRQFVQQFIAPLALMALVDIHLGQLLRTYPDGLPLSLVSALLPVRTRLNFMLNTHINPNERELKRTDLADLFVSLREAITGLNYQATEHDLDVSGIANPFAEMTVNHEHLLIREYIGELAPAVVWDVNAVDSQHSHLAHEQQATVFAFSDNLYVVENLYREFVGIAATVTPLYVDWANPSPAGGWANREQRTIGARANADVLLAVGLAQRLHVRHHIAFDAIAGYFARLAPHMIVDFAPITDPGVIALQIPGQNVSYTQAQFESAFAEAYEIVRAERIKHTERILYMLQRRE